jgi:hypothetical protein
MAKLKRFPSIAVRFDKNAVALFSRKDGTKMRFALGSYEKATKPELVDIKISDFCSFGCTFCYQASTLQGKHADLDDVKLIVDRLSKAGVFEVAIGGGEPLEYPHIIETFRLFKEAGIVPNFTTKFPGLVRKHWHELEPLIGGFAYSAENAAQIRSAAKLFRNIPKRFVNLHYVMGLGDREHFKEYLTAAAEAGFRVTLLGYKTSGRGKDVIPFPYDWWIEAVNELIAEGNCPSLSIDTPLADQYHGEMPVPTYSYHRNEGAFSMYIDAVAMTMGASSFDKTEELIPFEDDWRKHYSKPSFARPGSDA